MDEERKKRYYSISEVSNMLGIKAHILRYWETEFPMLKPRKNRAGNRAYTEHDIKTVMMIKTLLYEEKYTIEGAKKYLKSRHDVIEDQQIQIPFARIKVKNELKEIREDLVEVIEKVKAL
jgi:DNA-binding transcriptional MerR regulator